MAIQYGMTEEQFWYGDIKLLRVYQKAYIRDKSYTAWAIGQYDMSAYSISLSNAFAKKGKKAEKYPDWKDPIQKIETKNLSSDSLEEKFRKEQIKQNAWLFNR